MYNVKLSLEEKERISKGDTHLLKEKLLESDRIITKSLKCNKNSQDIAFLQGASSVIDKLLEMMPS